MDPDEERAMRPADPGLQRAEVLVLEALHDRVRPPADAMSGHALREQLQAMGLAKLDVTVATRSLVAYGLVARVRRDDPDGRFYTAYQLTPQGVRWLGAHAEAGRGAGSD